MFAKKHFLNEQAVDMLVDMRWQFACMLADIKLVTPGKGGGRSRDWMDDLQQPFNAHTSKQAVVSNSLVEILSQNKEKRASCCYLMCCATPLQALPLIFLPACIATPSCSNRLW